MKCRICGRRAIIKLRQHNLPLCRDHFIERFLKETERTIRRYKMFQRRDTVLVAVSGGKDSLSLLHALKQLGYNLKAIFIDLGIPGSSEISKEKVKKLANELDVELIVVSLKEKVGETLPEVIKRRPQHKICSLCGMIKRYLMNRTAYELDINVVATGHNLDDEIALLLSNTLRWQVSYLVKQTPFLESEGPKLAAKAKPFAFHTEREIGAYAIINKIDYNASECPYSKGAKTLLYKHMLNEIEVRSPGTKLRFYKEFLDFRDRYLKDANKDRPQMKECKICGMPTSLDVCAFCKVFAQDRTTNTSRES